MHALRQVGGDCGNSNIELHDVRFSVGEQATDCYDDLRRQWWGDPKSLHLDCWGAVEQADGFDVALSRVPSPDAQKLFFLNMGGYDGFRFEELHENLLLVGPAPRDVFTRAMAEVRKRWTLPHKDRVMEVEKSICLSETLGEAGWHVHLTPAAESRPFQFTTRYVRLTQPDKVTPAARPPEDLVTA